jgi:hypothetical protein
MLTKVLGIDIQAIYMTMLALVGLYLVLTHASALNAIVKTSATAGTDALVILEGRNVKTAARAA